MKPVFEFIDYRRFIEAKIEFQGPRRGYRTRLSEVAGCQPAYLSQVLAGRANMTSDQASNLADYWEMGELEAEYFLTLVESDRAASASLQRRLKSKLRRIHDEFHAEFSTYRQPSVEERGAAELYYSSWIFSALHVLLSIPQMQTVDALARHFSLSEAEIRSHLSAMQEQGLAQPQAGDPNSWRPVQKNLHAVTGTLYSALHHRNWRLRAIETIEPKKRSGNLHYTAIYSLTEENFTKLKEILLDAIDETRAVVEPSREEMVGCFLIDWFKI